ncbi:FHA domain-containing protein [Streptomyces sp. NPDC057617]|uniref:FHA domain-containing protein n=1 Tax=Streptomyces sp. NPDC057617 TaxID=3346184 RepID=UPI00367891A8
MQIRLTVLAPHGGHAAARACDVLVTAPAGTALAAVASGLATAVSGPDASGAVVLYAGRERLDAQRRTLGEPPLIDGAVLSLQVPGEDDAPADDAPTQLHVVAGPDAGGVHLLHGGRIRIGRSADADVPLDDPDVSRIHCAVTVGEDGRVSVADLGSTNGTTLEGAPVGERPVPLPPGALLRLGESALRLTSGERPPVLPTAPDGEGHLRIVRTDGPPGSSGTGGPAAAPGSGPTTGAYGTGGFGTDGSEYGPEGASPGPQYGSGLREPAPDGPVRGDQGRDGQGRGESHTGRGYGGSVPAGASSRVLGPQYGNPPGAPRVPDPRTADTHYGFRGRMEPPSDDSHTRATTPDPSEATPSRHPGAAPGDSTPYEHTGTGPDDPWQTGTSSGRGRHAGSGPDDGTAWQSGGGPAEETPYRQSGAGQAGQPGQPDGSAWPTGTGPDDSWRTDASMSDGRARPSGTGAGPDDSTPWRTGSGPADSTSYGHGLGGPGSGVPAQGSAGAADGHARHAGTPYSAGSASGSGSASGDDGPQGHSRTGGARRQGTPPRGTEAPEAAARRRGGIGAWARRLAGGRDEEPAAAGDGGPGSTAGAAGQGRPETCPDPAAVLLTALGPGPRLWERDSRHPDALVVRLGTADRPAAAAPVTVCLREAGSLALAGPRERISGMARWAVAQLAALHSPADLEIVLISTDRTRTLEERRDDWGWLGWLPHVRPAHGQDCRLLLAYDRDQAAARTAELTRRLDDGPLGTGWASADPWTITEAAARHDGPYTLVIVDGDPGSAALRETTAQLAGAGAAAGIHLLCLAETPAASPLSPVAATYETACAASLPFRECGAVALLSGDVATTLRLLRTSVGQPTGHGTVAVVDAVSAAWAERFGRALAPLRAAAGSGRSRPTAVLPRSARLLDELGLARATPASLMARWASAADRTGDCTAVLGAGPRGPLSVDLTEEGPHLLIEGPPGSGRTELLRSVAASLAAAGPPDQLGLLLVDGAGGERGEGLSACTELPHVTEHLIASDPVRMREFAQALGAELKRRAELLGRSDFAEWHREWGAAQDTREVPDRLTGQRGAGTDRLTAQRAPGVDAPTGRHAPGADAPIGRHTSGGDQSTGRHALGGDGPADQRGPATDRFADQRSSATDRFADQRTPSGDRFSDQRAPSGDGLMGQRGPTADQTMGRRTPGADRFPDRFPGQRTVGTDRLTDQRTPGPDPMTGRRAPSPDPSTGRRIPGADAPAGSYAPSPDRPAGRHAQAAPEQRSPRRAESRVDLPEQQQDGPRADPEAAARGAVRLRTAAGSPGHGQRPAPLPRLVVLVDDFDALVAPALGSPGRPAAGSVVRALEAVARDGERLGVHLVAASARPDRTVDTELAQGARLRVVLDAPPVAPSPDDPAPGRGRLGHPDGRVTPFQGGRVTGRIPRTATLRPTVVVLEWERMGDPPARRPVRELGNGPTDLALLASALDRAARSVDAVPVAPLTPAHP